jgi:single-stranded DNA-binding protein
VAIRPERGEIWCVASLHDGIFQAACWAAPMNNVSLVGALVTEPQLTAHHDGREACLIQIEVPRRSLTGQPLPGVIYVDVATFGQQARICAELTIGRRIALSGTLERNDSLGRGPRRSRWEVYAHHVELIDPPAPPSG